MVDGTIGNDLLEGGAGDDLFDGLEGNDTINGGAGLDSLFGGDGDDSIDGGAGIDSMNGGLGNDTIVAGLGDVVIGGASSSLDEGKDYLVLDASAATSRLSLNFSAGSVQVGTVGALLKVSYMEGGDITMTKFDDLFTNSKVNTLNDIVRAGAGNDQAFTDLSGTDSFVMAGGNDLLKVTGTSLTEGVSITSSGGTAATGYAGTVTDGTNTTTFSGVERFQFAAVGTGNDTIVSGASIDNIKTGAGNDLVNSGGGNDVVFAGAGNDTLNSGGGNDQLSGGTDADLFVFAKAGASRDTVTDFEDGVDIMRVAGVANFAALTLTNTKAGVVIKLDDNSTITLKNMVKADLSAADFIFV